MQQLDDDLMGFILRGVADLAMEGGGFTDTLIDSSFHFENGNALIKVIMLV